jgi:predicted nucleic acid-binding protein
VILVDTSIWVNHLRQANPPLQQLLTEGSVVTHPFIIGELACGSLRNRKEILGLMTVLPTAVLANHDEVLDMVESNRLFGKGLGWIDAHLLASALLSRIPLWTLDQHLRTAARALAISYE